MYVDIFWQHYVYNDLHNSQNIFLKAYCITGWEKETIPLIYFEGLSKLATERADR